MNTLIKLPRDTALRHFPGKWFHRIAPLYAIEDFMMFVLKDGIAIRWLLLKSYDG